MSPCPEPMSPILKNTESRVQSTWTFYVSQTVNLKAETKTFCYIDTDEIPGFFQSRKFGIR